MSGALYFRKMACDMGHKGKKKNSLGPHIYIQVGFWWLTLLLFQVRTSLKISFKFWSFSRWLPLISFWHLFLCFPDILNIYWYYFDFLWKQENLLCLEYSRYVKVPLVLTDLFSFHRSDLQTSFIANQSTNQHLLCIWLWMQGISCFRFSAQESKFINLCAWVSLHILV